MKYLALALATGSLAFAEQFVTGQAARAVIGQPTFTRQQPGASATILGGVSGIAYANDTLVVVDSNRVQASPQNHRVLIYNNISSKLPGPRSSIRWEGQRCPLCGFSADLVLGQPDFSKTEWGAGRTRLRTPTGVATDGRVLAVADTDNNRVLIWNSIPASINQPPDVVVGQPDFDKVGLNYGGTGNTPSARGLRGPQGVWIDQSGRFIVADTQNHRVLVWNQVPRENGKAADLVLGKPDFTTFVEVDLTQAQVNATAANLLNPVSATTDPEGRLYVTDLGHNRVVIWNRFPTQNGQSADLVLGQPDVASTTERKAELANNSSALCPSNGTDSEGKPTYPPLCAATLSFPRFALSDGKRLFVADGGNDRVLVWNTIPTRNGQPADVVLGQLSDTLLIDSADLRISSADSVRTPMSLAWDGVNLYVTDPFNRRVLVWTMADQQLLYTGVRNAASQEIFAVGSITFTADPKENDEVTVKIGTGDAAKEYKYKAKANEKIADVIRGVVELINAGSGDPLVFASPNVAFNAILLTSRVSGEVGNNIEFTVTFSEGAQLTGTGSGKLAGGQDAAKIAPGSIVLILGENLAEQTASAPDVDPLPTSLGGVEVYVDGIAIPLFSVSPTRITAQMPWEVNDASSVNAYVRITGADGSTRITSAIAVPIIPQNPGIFAREGTDPRQAIALHGSSYATGVVSVDGTVKENDVATVTIEDRSYSYTVKAGDTLASIRDALVNEINNDEKVMALPSSIYTRIVLRSRIPGKDGEGITYTAKANDGANVILTPLTPALCCANQEGTPITEENPALPGETIIIYATGLGFVQPDEAKGVLATGFKFRGPEWNTPNAAIDAIAGGKTANVLFAGLKPGEVGMYELRLQLNADIPTNPQTQLTIAQDVYVSNIVTFPVVNPKPPETEPAP